MILVNEKSGCKYIGKRGPVYFSEEKDFEKFYFTKGMKIYSDKIAKFVCRCEEKSKGAVLNRITRIYQKIYIDEVQDLAGYDLEIIKLLLKNDTSILMVGDPRQVTYHTHSEAKYKKYSNGNIEEFILNECKRINCEIDKETLNSSYRNNDLICLFSSKLYPEYKITESKQTKSTKHDEIFLVKPEDIDDYLSEYDSIQLRDKRTISINEKYDAMNMGESKGLTFKRVLIYSTNTMVQWMKNNSKELKTKARSQFYVALTRA